MILCCISRAGCPFDLLISVSFADFDDDEYETADERDEEDDVSVFSAIEQHEIDQIQREEEEADRFLAAKKLESETREKKLQALLDFQLKEAEEDSVCGSDSSVPPSPQSLSGARSPSFLPNPHFHIPNLDEMRSEIFGSDNFKLPSSLPKEEADLTITLKKPELFQDDAKDLPLSLSLQDSQKTPEFLEAL